MLFSMMVPALERHSDPDGCFTCHGLPGLEYRDDKGVLRVASILRSDYYGSLHGSVPCKDCHRKIERYPHKPEEGYVDCSESCHLQEPSQGKAFTHKPVVEEFRRSVHGSGHAPGATKDFHGGNRLREETEEQNPSCRRCHSNTPYIAPANLERFKEAFHHVDTECGTCHRGETWRDQFSGHILRRLVGKNYDKRDANAMCIGCHGDHAAMAKVRIRDPATQDLRPASFRFIHAVDSYAKTLHGRLLEAGIEKGANCIDCHAPDGFRHGVLRDEVPLASTHPANLRETCSQSGCHGYAMNLLSLGFVQTDLHDLDYIQMRERWFALDFSRFDSAWYTAAWILFPLALIFLVSSLFSPWSRPLREGDTPVLGHGQFQRIMIGSPIDEESFWLAPLRLLRRSLRGGDADGRPAQDAITAIAVATPITSMTVLFGSQTGNGEGIAHDLARRARARGFRVELVDMADYEPSRIVKERLLFVIVSTHGEGEPPLPAKKLHAFLYSEEAPALPHLRFAVFALGDSSYKHFCRAGKDFDAFFQRLGASRVLPRVDADVDFEGAASDWIERVLMLYRDLAGEDGIVEPVPDEEASSQAPARIPVYSKSHPYPAQVLVNRNLNGPGSAKETRHLEIDLGDSGLVYEPGDALGVYPKNDPAYVEHLLANLPWNGYTEVLVEGEAMTIREAFYKYLDVTQLSRSWLERYAERVGNVELQRWLGDDKRLDEYLWGRQILDLVGDFPPRGVSAQTFVDGLRRLPPRLYSIASSLKVHPGQVHLTVGVVRYHAHGRNREGVCSTYLANRLGSPDAQDCGGERPRIYVQPNKSFRLPVDPARDIIMIGPGTGVAPFRAFVEEREATAASGKNWLFFGDQHRSCDFLYAEEWEDKLRRGVLTRLDLAFSRDQAEKIYVQHRMQENARSLYAWLEEGAYCYVCGDASRMARDVHEALIGVVMQAGGKSREAAETYVDEMAAAGRYQRDVY